MGPNRREEALQCAPDLDLSLSKPSTALSHVASVSILGSQNRILWTVCTIVFFDSLIMMFFEWLYEKLVTCDDEPFRHLREAPLWSASANLDFATSAWAFDFSTGEAIVKPRDHALQLLLVSGIC